MADTGTIKVEGLAELFDNLASFDAKLRNKYLKAAGKAAGSYLAERAREKAPMITKPTRQRMPGELKRSIGFKVSLTKKKGLVVRIGPQFTKGGEFKRSPGFWGKFVEYGTVTASARPYLRPAFDTGKAAALDAFTSKLKEQIESFKP
jgi:HK97 gp10 family phage protein